MSTQTEISLEKINPLNDMLGVVLQAVSDWRAKNTESALKTRVHELLDRNSKEITMKLLGFDSRYGQQWELDHCNGRAGESAAGDYLKRVQQDAIQDWLQSVELPKLDASLTKAMVIEIRNDYKRFLKSYLYDYARNQADKDAKEIIQSLFSTSKADGMQKLQELLASKD